MNFTKGKKVYVFFDPQVSPSFVEALTIQKQSDDLLFFEEKKPYYAIQYKSFLFYGYSYTVAGDVLVVENFWLLPLAKLLEQGRHIAGFFRRKTHLAAYGNLLEEDSSPVF